MRRSVRWVRWLRWPWVAMAAGTGVASAQPTPAPDGVAVGDFWFRPRLELRVRGEYEHHPVSTSGEEPLLGSALGMPTRVTHQWIVQERARFGLRAERGPLAAGIMVQDARVAGVPDAGAPDSDGRSTTSFHLAYIEAHSPETHPSFVRIGRQEVTWGEGRLLGPSDWLLVPRAFDAARARLVVRQLDVEALAVLLVPPEALPPDQSGAAPRILGADNTTGAQLYGLDFNLHVDPLLHAELTGLARIVRSTAAPNLTPSDTFVADARVFGDRAGLSYSAEIGFEAGRVALVGANRNLRAWAATAHVDWQSSWLLRPRVSIAGSYATGGDGTGSETIGRFDPIAPDARAGLGQMGFFAWSNVVDAAITGAATPLDDLTLAIGFRHVRLADPRDAWFTASLFPVGQNRQNDDALLGHEIDAMISYAPYDDPGRSPTGGDALMVSAGYGAFITASGARAILSGQPSGDPRILSAAFVQVSAAAP